MRLKVQRRLRRRWYLSLLPIALLAPFALPFSETLIRFSGHSPLRIPLACVTGLIVGVLLAALSATVAVVTIVQMSAAVRMFLVMCFFHLTATIVIAVPSLEITSHYLAEGMLVFFGAFAATLVTRDRTAAQTAPPARC